VQIPLAVMGSIGAVTVVYILASLALVSMQPYNLISRSSGFSEAFYYNDVRWAGELVAVGELVTLPLVVLVSFLAQPRLQYAMAEDGLLPKIFSEVDAKGNLFKVRRPMRPRPMGRIRVMMVIIISTRGSSITVGSLHAS
jgi:amino acid transporter